MGNYLVIDFEATCCDRGSVPRSQMEIIEIGAVMVEAQTWKKLGEFQTFIRPGRHPQLSTFCTRLTSIAQTDVDSAPDFVTAISELKTWMYGIGDFVFCSWGDYDRRQLEQDCAYHRIPYPMTAGHTNLKKAFSNKQGLPKKLGMAGALKHAGIALEGTHHRGIDDARNIARLLPYCVGECSAD